MGYQIIYIDEGTILSIHNPSCLVTCPPAAFRFNSLFCVSDQRIISSPIPIVLQGHQQIDGRPVPIYHLTTLPTPKLSDGVLPLRGIIPAFGRSGRQSVGRCC